MHETLVHTHSPRVIGTSLTSSFALSPDEMGGGGVRKEEQLSVISYMDILNFVAKFGESVMNLHQAPVYQRPIKDCPQNL